MYGRLRLHNELYSMEIHHAKMCNALPLVEGTMEVHTLCGFPLRSTTEPRSVFLTLCHYLKYHTLASCSDA